MQRRNDALGEEDRFHVAALPKGRERRSKRAEEGEGNGKECSWERGCWFLSTTSDTSDIGGSRTVIWIAGRFPED